MSVLGTLTEGGQTWAHRIRMLRQVFKLAALFSFVISLLAFIILMFKVHPLLYQSAWYYTKANTIGLAYDTISIDPDFWEKVTQERHFTSDLQVSPEKVSAYLEPYANHFMETLLESISRTQPYSYFSFIGLLCFFFIRGFLRKRTKHIAGRKKSPAWLIALRLKLSRKASFMKLGSLPLVKGTETQHMMVTGGTGSGKTNCFHHILPQIRMQKQRAVIVDTTGVFVDAYYRKDRDILLNPFDHRGLPWHPWIECEEKFDFDALAESFIPQTSSQHENYWRIAARTLFSSVLQKLEDTNKTSELSRWLLFEPLPKLCDFVQGTKAGAHLDMSSEKTAGSIRSVATTFLECLEHIPDTCDPFSIRDWIRDENSDSWLFLQCKPSQRATLSPLLACWFSIAARNLLQLSPDFKRRIWFIIDELPSLHRLKELENFISEGRKYGGCGLFAFQSPAQLESIYGHATAKTIIGNCMTKIVFAEQDPEVASMISKSFGEREVKEYQEGLSYGAHEARDGVNLSLQTRMLPAVSATEIQSLDRNQAYIKLPGSLPITKIKLPITKVLQ